MVSMVSSVSRVRRVRLDVCLPVVSASSSGDPSKSINKEIVVKRLALLRKNRKWTVFAIFGLF
jgi:hypothetical protein